MSRSAIKSDLDNRCHILTNYPADEFTLTWHVTNYTKIFNDASAVFSTISDTTKWKVRLDKVPRPIITLQRQFDGPEVYVFFTSTIFTYTGLLENDGSFRFYKNYDRAIIMNIPLNINFRNDILNFKCALTTLGLTVTKKIHSVGLEVMNFDQISSDMNYLFEKQEHCDLTIVVGGDEIKVHKCILCARSPVFRSLFQHSMSEADQREIRINDIKFSVLKDFLRFLYCGELKNLTWNKAWDLYYAADKYEVMSLRKTCSLFLQFNMGVNQVGDVLALADRCKDVTLKRYVIYYAQLHASIVKYTQNWEEMSESHPELALEVFRYDLRP